MRCKFNHNGLICIKCGDESLQRVPELWFQIIFVKIIQDVGQDHRLFGDRTKDKIPDQILAFFKSDRSFLALFVEIILF
jgi:hypothetical protein